MFIIQPTHMYVFISMNTSSIHEQIGIDSPSILGSTSIDVRICERNNISND